MSDEHPLIGRSVKMIARALIDGWEMPDAVRKACIARMAEVIADKGAKRRDVATAVRTLLSMEKVRIDGMRVVGEQSQASQLTDPEAARRAMREDPEYIDFLRQKAIAEDEAGDGAE